MRVMKIIDRDDSCYDGKHLSYHCEVWNCYYQECLGASCLIHQSVCPVTCSVHCSQGTSNNDIQFFPLLLRSVLVTSLLLSGIDLSMAEGAPRIGSMPNDDESWIRGLGYIVLYYIR